KTDGVAGTGKGGGSVAGVGQDSGGGGGTGVGGGGGREPLVLDYGDVYEGKLYQRRSFVIVNHAAMPLEFQLSSSLPASELNFSLSAATLKQFKSVHVEAKTRLQVYAHYRPVAKSPAAVARKGSQRALDMSAAADDPGKEAEAVTVRERLSITCRLVKDFQQEIQLFARRHSPQLHVLVEGNATAAGRNRCSESSNGILFVVRETAATQPSSSTADTDPTTESKGGSASSSSGASIIA
ncbi:unnamed protein product, partial [Ectocarpus sp. 13 AM-2016]